MAKQNTLYSRAEALAKLSEILRKKNDLQPATFLRVLALRSKLSGWEESRERALRNDPAMC